MLNEPNLGDLSNAEADWDNAPDLPASFCKELPETFTGVLMYAGHYTAEKALLMFENGLADIFEFDRSYMANADLPERVRAAVTFNALDAATLFAVRHAGYTDCPMRGSVSATTTTDLDVTCV